VVSHVGVNFLLYSDVHVAAWLTYSCNATWAMALVLYLVLIFQDPGSVDRSSNLNFEQILAKACQMVPPNTNQSQILDQICFVCRVIKPARSKHCYRCGRCINRFDHHCPWLNSCVGLKNHALFVAYLSLLSSYLLAASLISMYVAGAAYMAPNNIFHEDYSHTVWR
jgi:hypothetical protein